MPSYEFLFTFEIYIDFVVVASFRFICVLAARLRSFSTAVSHLSTKRPRSGDRRASVG